MAQTPRLMCSPITGNVYIVTKYKDLGDGNYEAIDKVNVSTEFDKIVSSIPNQKITTKE